jgi:hypothetical protein
MQVGAEFTLLGLAQHRRHHAPANDEATDVGALGLLDEFLHEEIGVQVAERLDDRLGRLVGFAQHDAATLRALRELDTTGAPPTRPTRSAVSSGAYAKPVTGMPMPLRASSWWARSLSRERVIATDSLSEYTPCISNWRTTAAP